MTLIVAKFENEKIYCIGDSKITYDKFNSENPFLNGCLKQYLFGRVMVGFAGDVKSFENDFHLYKKAQNSLEIVKIAQKYQKNNYEIIVADNDTDKIYTVKNSISNASEVGFIGDEKAFSKYQKAYHQNKPIILDSNHAQINIIHCPEPVFETDTYCRMYNAFKSVVQDETIESVDGVIVTLAKHNGRLRYMMYCDIYTDEVIIPEPGESKRINFGSVEGGGYSVEFSKNNETSEDGTIPAYYFLQGGFGIIFNGEDNELMRPVFISAANPCHWALETKRIIGESVISGYLTLDHCGIAGEEYLESGNHEMAFQCYKMRLESAKKGKESRPKLDRYFSGYYVSYYNCGNKNKAIEEMSKLVFDNPDFNRCHKYLETMKKMI